MARHGVGVRPLVARTGVEFEVLPPLADGGNPLIKLAFLPENEPAVRLLLSVGDLERLLETGEQVLQVIDAHRAHAAGDDDL